jgi:DNA-binding NarL/FixJ family response regulator
MAKISKTELIKLQKTLKTDATIGKMFGITRQAIHLIRQKHGIPAAVNTKNDARNAEILSLHNNGLTGKAIAKKVGLSVGQTYIIIRTSAKSNPK